MKTPFLLGVAGAAGAVVALGQLSDANPVRTDGTVAKDRAVVSNEDPHGDPIVAEGEAQADVIVFSIQGTANYGPVGDYRAYSFGTTSCNIGNVPLNWFAGNNQHPVIGQNLFRLAPGQNGHLRFEQLGQSWLKHGFCALSQYECGDCQETNCNTLGVLCSDPYTASRNGNQGPAGPKYQVNTTTGFFPYPPADPSYSGSIARRLRVLTSETDPAQNPDAKWFAEAQYVTADDNPSVDLIRAANNVSYREVRINSSGQATGFDDVTQTEQIAMYAWKAEDPGVKITWVAIPDEGSIYVGSRAYDNGDGTWDYEYAVQNLDSDRSIGSVTFPVPESVTVTNYGYRDVEYHSGEPFNSIDWGNARNTNDVTWAATETFAQNQNANAIRWANMFNFRFTADSAPTDAEMSFTFFKPGDTGDGGTAAVVAPLDLDACLADLNGDDVVNFDDLVQFLSEWGFCLPSCAEDINGDFWVDFNDLVILLAEWGPC